jgi:gluconolactonase
MISNPALTIYNESIKQYINVDFEIQTLDGSCSFSEGPVWNPQGFYLFSDIPKNCICKISEENNKEIFIERSGCTLDDTTFLSPQIGSNGLTYNNEGDLLICQHGNGAIAKWDGNTVIPIISEFKNKRFNSPNDIVVHENESVFFSDPPYGLLDQQLMPGRFQSLAGIYCFKDEQVILICDKFQYPNGVCLSPDHKILYCCSNKPSEKFVLMYDAATLELKGALCEENGDGIKCDKKGNLFLCTRDGLLILDEKGNPLGLIKLKTIPANCGWGGVSGNDLLLTARENIFLIKDLQR